MEDHPEVLGLPPGSLEDKDLTLAYQRGEDGAYQAIYDRYSDRVHSVCRRMLGNSHDAQDAAQETFLRVYQALGRFNGRYQLGPWITRIATNVCLDHIRAKSRRPKDVVPLEVVELDPQEEGELHGPDDIVIRKSEGRRVRKVLEALPPMHRAAIVLRDFEGLSYQEVAIALGISDSQVKALIHRARQGFKRSWSSIALSALIPARVFQRLRKLHTPKANGSQSSSVHHLAESFTASAAPAASSCSGAFSQCGQFVADKFAPALTAVALGAASFALPGGRDEPPPEPEQHRVATNSAAEMLPTSVSRRSKTEVQASSDTDDRVDTQGDGSRSEPDPAPAPAKQPGPVASPTPGPAPSPTSSPSPAPPAPPPPLTSSDGGSSGGQPAPKPSFTAAVGFNSPGPASAPLSHQYRLSCASRQFEQTLVTKIVHAGRSYEATLYVNATTDQEAVRLTIRKDYRSYEYVSWGNRTPAAWNIGEKSGEIGISGDYGAAYGETPQEEGLPEAGTFSVKIGVHCGSSPSPTTESVVFTTR